MGRVKKRKVQNEYSYRKIFFSMILLLYFLVGVVFFAYLVLMPRYISYSQENYNQTVQYEVYNIFMTAPQNQLLSQLKDLRDNKYPIEIAVSKEGELLFQTIPGNDLAEFRYTIQSEMISYEVRGIMETSHGKYDVWYVIYHQRPQDYFNALFYVILSFIFVAFTLLVLIIFILQKRLLDPLMKVKQAINKMEEDNLSTLELSEDEISQDTIGEKVNQFAINLRQRVKVVSRNHTELEYALQLERERLSNLMLIARGIIHDLKTPVHQTLVENDYVLRERQELNDVEKVILAYNIRRMDKILNQINDALNIMDTDVTKMIEDNNDVDVVELFTNIKSAFQVTIREKEIIFISEIPDNLVININKVTLHMIIHNLLSNAIKYTTEEGEIEFAFYREEDNIYLTCENTANEIDIERMKKNTELFQAVVNEGDDERYIYSTGNGLYLLGELAELLNGTCNIIYGDEYVSISIKIPVKTQQEVTTP
jgi:Histidine kinase-, DNA gyrase B-, and HSP90-like ATPase.